MRQIPLTQGMFAIVDDSNYVWLNQYKWYAHKDTNTYYACRCIDKHTKVTMHREILSLQHNDGILTDHKNHNGLDNRRENLRICSNQENLQNQISVKGSSKYKGVTWNNSSKKWQAQLHYNKKEYYLGVFDEEIMAAKAYNKKAQELFGDFACLNMEIPDIATAERERMSKNIDVFEAKLNNLEQRINDVRKALDELRTQVQILSEIDGFQLDVHQYYINKDKRMAHAPIHIAGNNHTLEEAEDFHRDFGDLINRFKASQT